MAFRGRVALVTGGGSGMGQICAWRLADQGAAVVAVDIDDDGLARTADGRSNIRTMACDVTDFDRVREVVAVVERDLGPIDRVTHAAGIMPTSLVMDDDVARVKRVMEVNYFGTLHVIKAALPQMLARRLGDFIVFGSVSAYALTPHMSAYTASKAAINALVETLIWETKGSGVRVHLTNPPMVNTPLLRQALETSNPRSIQQGIERKIPAEPGDIVDAVERALERGQTMSFPTAMAKGLYGMRRVAPTLLWNVIVRSEQSA